MKKALIFFGGWAGHYPLETTAVYKDILEELGFEVITSDTLEILNEYETVKQFDLIVSNWTNGTITASQCRNVMKAVAEGTGLAGSHGGIADAFRQSPEWQFMTGAQWVAHPGGAKVTYKVALLRGNEFTEGLNDFTVTSEQYYMHVDPAVKVYAITEFPAFFDGDHSPNGRVKMPVVFSKMWGKGRVFINSVGHDCNDLMIPEIHEILKRGFNWAAR